MPINSIVHNTHLEKLRRSILDEALGITQKNVDFILKWADMLNMDPVDYEKMIDGFLSSSKDEQDIVITKIIQGYLSKMKANIVSRELYLRMLVTQHTTSSNSGK